MKAAGWFVFPKSQRLVKGNVHPFWVWVGDAQPESADHVPTASAAFAESLGAAGFKMRSFAWAQLWVGSGAPLCVGLCWCLGRPLHLTLKSHCYAGFAAKEPLNAFFLFFPWNLNCIS